MSGWGTLDDKYVESEQKAVDSVSSGKYFKAKLNDNIIRVLPPWSSKVKWPFKWVWQHSYVDAEGNRRMFVCPKTNNRKDGPKHECLTCDHVIPKLKEGDTDDQELAAQLRASVGVVCNIVDRNNESAGAQIWRLSSTKLYPQLLSAIRDPDYGNITHPKTGFDIKLTRTGEGLDTKYSLMMKPKPNPIDLSDVEPIDLDEEYKVTSNSDQAEILKKAYGLTGLDEHISDETIEEELDENDVPFDHESPDASDEQDEEDDDTPFSQLWEVHHRGEEEEEQEEEPAPEKSKGKGKKGGSSKAVKRVPIEIEDEDDMSKAQKTKVLNVLIKKSKCFGKFDENDPACEECAAMIKCAGAVE